MGTNASQNASITIVYSTVYSGADKKKNHQSSASLAFVRGPVNSPHKWPVTRKMFPFDDVIMILAFRWAFVGEMKMIDDILFDLLNKTLMIFRR